VRKGKAEHDTGSHNRLVCIFVRTFHGRRKSGTLEQKHSARAAREHAELNWQWIPNRNPHSSPLSRPSVQRRQHGILPSPRADACLRRICRGPLWPMLMHLHLSTIQQRPAADCGEPGLLSFARLHPLPSHHILRPLLVHISTLRHNATCPAATRRARGGRRIGSHPYAASGSPGIMHSRASHHGDVLRSYRCRVNSRGAPRPDAPAVSASAPRQLQLQQHRQPTGRSRREARSGNPRRMVRRSYAWPW